MKWSTPFKTIFGAIVLFVASETSAQDAIGFGDWKATSGFDGPRTSHAGLLVNNRLYILGGYSYSAVVTYYDEVQSGGSRKRRLNCLGDLAAQRFASIGALGIRRGIR